MLQLLLDIPSKFSIFSSEGFRTARSKLPQARMDDILRLPAPLHSAWFQQIHSLTIQLDFSTSEATCKQLTCIGALTFASQLLFLSLEGVSKSQNLNLNLNSKSTPQDRSLHGKNAGGTAGHQRQQQAVCSFQMVKGCLLGKPNLKELQLHGVEVSPVDMMDFATIMRCGLRDSLERLTLCRCLFPLACLHKA
jgi:hypothetical protein